MSRPVATRILSPKRTDNAAAVPPALRIGPAKYTATYLLPSELLLIFTPEIPSKGAATTPSVKIAKAVLNPWSAKACFSASSLAPVSFDS